MTHIYLGTIIPLIHYWHAEGFITKGSMALLEPKRTLFPQLSKPYFYSIPSPLLRREGLWNRLAGKLLRSPLSNMYSTYSTVIYMYSSVLLQGRGGRRSSPSGWPLSSSYWTCSSLSYTWMGRSSSYWTCSSISYTSTGKVLFILDLFLLILHLDG